MPTLALPVFVDGAVADPVPVEQAFYNQSVAGTGSLEVINGHLDRDNRQGAWPVTKDHIQEGALSGGGAVGGNVNLDYFGDVFIGYNQALETLNPDKAWQMYRAIPGGSVEYFLPYACSLVVLSWTIFASSMHDLTVPDNAGVGADREGRQADFDTTGGKIRLFVDGNVIPAKIMEIPSMMHNTPGGIGTGGDMVGTFDRPWAGHILLSQPAELTQGWHSASLRIATVGQDSAIPPAQGDQSNHSQSRVRCRHMDYVYFL